MNNCITVVVLDVHKDSIVAPAHTIMGVIVSAAPSTLRAPWPCGYGKRAGKA
jgi:hypothetical protein